MKTRLLFGRYLFCCRNIIPERFRAFNFHLSLQYAIRNKGEKMKTLIIVESKHCGNTRKLAEAMANAVPGTAVTDTEGAKGYDMNDFDLVGFGSGIYAGSFDRRITNLVTNFGDKPEKAFVFSTSGGGDIGYNQKLIDLLKMKNKTVVGSFACKGLDKFFVLRLIGGVNKGSPTGGDLQNAAEFFKGLQQDE